MLVFTSDRHQTQTVRKSERERESARETAREGERGRGGLQRGSIRTPFEMSVVVQNDKLINNLYQHGESGESFIFNSLTDKSHSASCLQTTY